MIGRDWKFARALAATVAAAPCAVQAGDFSPYMTLIGTEGAMCTLERDGQIILRVELTGSMDDVDVRSGTTHGPITITCSKPGYRTKTVVAAWQAHEIIGTTAVGCPAPSGGIGPCPPTVNLHMDYPDHLTIRLTKITE
jgi:hypothetical protein